MIFSQQFISSRLHGYKDFMKKVITKILFHQKAKIYK